MAKYPKIPSLFYDKGKVQKKRKNKLTSVSFMYVCVAGNGEMLVFFSFFPPTIVKKTCTLGEKKEKC